MIIILLKLDNYIKDHFPKIGCIAKGLTGTAFETIE